ncbi:MAG TPA: hypothetical protein ENK18_05830 [Deltaproteobacteria bacterium]|nr:hypothetical protein [Deltaproteobacteria bacterium]
MSVLLLLAACGDKPPPRATEPDPRSSELLAGALCKLSEGAGHDCSQQGAQVMIEGKTLSVDSFLDREEETLGQFTFDGRARITVSDGAVLTTRFQHYGWGREEAFDKGVHYWAVLSGAPIIDWVLADPSRPALRALERGQPLLAHQIPVGPFRALRGWTFLQGVKIELDHHEIVASLADTIQRLPADSPHTIDVRITSDMGEQVYTCHLDGEEAPQLCEAARRAPWPAGIGWELRQIYLLAPAASFPKAPPEAPGVDPEGPPEASGSPAPPPAKAP